MKRSMSGASDGMRCLAWFLCSAVLALFLAQAARAEQKFLEPGQAFALTVAMATPTELDVHYKIAPAYYMYRERFKFALSPDGQRLGAPVFPKGIVKYDPNFEKNVEIYHGGVTIRVPIQAGSSQPLTLAVTGQGCADAGLCYPPMTAAFVLRPTSAGYTVSGPGAVARLAPQGADAPPGGTSLGAVLNMGDTGVAAFLASAGWAKIVLVCLALGLLLSFTPCVLPMVPILLAVVAGATGTRARVSRWRGLSLAGAYVLGMSVVYTVLGVLAGLIGASLSIWLQTPWVLALFAVLLALLALAMFDAFTLQVPSGVQSALNNRLSRIPGGHFGAALVMGMLSALIVGPCVAAPLAGVLLFISQTGNLVLGGVALFALAWGQGLLLLAVGGSSGALLPKAGAWMDGIKQFFGMLLLATAWWMVDSILPAWLSVLGWAALALGGAVMLRAFEPMAPGGGMGAVLRKACGLLLALWAALILVGAASGGYSVWQPLKGLWRVPGRVDAPASPPAAPGPLALAVPPAGPGGSARQHFAKVASSAQLDALLARTTRPVMLDFYADWCVSCIEMEKFTFSDPVVARKMSRLLLVRADVTGNTADDRALLKRFKLFGPPGIMFFDAHGRLLGDARVVGFKNAAQFSAVLDRVLGAGN